MSTDIEVNKPAPSVPGKKIESFKRGSDIKHAINVLEAGNPILITEFFSNGLSLLSELKTHLNDKFPSADFKEQRAYSSAYRTLSNLILIEIAGHKLGVKKAPAIGWLEKLYPTTPDFFLSFPQVQGLNSSWQWYKNGITIPVLRNKIHPYYGTHFPTRFEQMEMFDNWLKRYTGPKKTAIDVGFGSGVLSLQMIQHGFQKVFGTDTNPNAIVGLKEFMGDTKLSRKIEVDFGHLFGQWEKQTELIVFNPPWLPELDEQDTGDDAIYYKDTLFPEFFEGAKQRLLPEGKLVLMFSNLAQLTNMTKAHPIKKELAEGGRFELEKCLTKRVKGASDKAKQAQHGHAGEEVELWVLKHK